MKPADQIDKACRLNIGQNFGGIQFMSIVTTQPKLIAKKPLSVGGQKSLSDEFNIWYNKQVVKVPEGKKVYLAYLLAHTVSKQV